MRVPGWWRVRHACHNSINLIKRVDSEIIIRLGGVQLGHRYIIRKAILPPQEVLFKIDSRKELLAIAYEHDKTSFYASEKSKKPLIVKKILFQLLLRMYKLVRYLMKIIYKPIKAIQGINKK